MTSHAMDGECSKPKITEAGKMEDKLAIFKKAYSARFTYSIVSVLTTIFSPTVI